MTTSSEQALKLNRFQQRTLVIFGLIAALASLPDSERRGLLVWNSPEALIADVADGTPGGLPGAIAFVRADGLPRRGAATGRPFVTATVGPVGDPALNSAPGGALSPAQATTSTSQPEIPVGIGPQNGPAAGGVPVGPGVGFAPAVIGATTLLAAPPAPPGVPAIPEPSSWVLMILGVGFLGVALRRTRKMGRSTSTHQLAG